MLSTFTIERFTFWQICLMELLKVPSTFGFSLFFFASTVGTGVGTTVGVIIVVGATVAVTATLDPVSNPSVLPMITCCVSMPKNPETNGRQMQKTMLPTRPNNAASPIVIAMFLIPLFFLFDRMVSCTNVYSFSFLFSSDIRISF